MRKAFPLAVGIGRVTVYVQADGSVVGDRAAYAAAVADLDPPIDPDAPPVGLVMAALLLNAPWREDGE